MTATVGAASNHPVVPFVDLHPMNAEVAEELDRTWRYAIETSGFIAGPAVERFEHEWARFCGTTEAVGTANGTDALTLALRALGVGDGDEVILPANTFIATAEAVALAGAAPRFADVDPRTLLLTPETITAAMGPRTAAIIVVHLYGQMPDMDAIGGLAASRGLVLVEDAAQAHGATWSGRKAGSFGRAGCFSFYPGKNLGALGDAGAVVTNDPSLARTVRAMANHGRWGSHHEHRLVGTNSRLDAVQAGALQAKLARLDQWNEGRRRASRLYDERLRALSGSVGLPRQLQGSRGVRHLYVVEVDDRDAVRRELGRRGVQTGVHYPVPCHRHQAFSRFAVEPLPVSERAADRLLSLPMFPHISPSQIERVCTELAVVVRKDKARNRG